MSDYQGDSMKSDRDRKAFERSYASMRALKEEIDVQLGTASLTEALYKDREAGFRPDGEADKRKESPAKSDA